MKNSKSLAQELEEVITKHIERESAASKDPALDGFPFQVIFAADENDNVKVTTRWPKDAPPAQSVRTMAKMLHHISAGHWKSPMVSSVKKQGLEQKQADVSQQILQQWAGASQQVDGSRLCVSPRHVFMRQRGQGHGH